MSNSVGCQTPLGNAVTGFTLMVVLLCLTGVFKRMSANVQGAIIIVGVLQLLDWREAVHLWKVRPPALPSCIACSAFLPASCIMPLALHRSASSTC